MENKEMKFSTECAKTKISKPAHVKLSKKFRNQPNEEKTKYK